MHTLAGWWTQQRRTLSLQKMNQGMWTFPNLKPGVFHEEEVTERPVAYKTATGKPVASSESDHPGSQHLKNRMATQSAHVSSHSSSHGSSLLDRQENLRTRTRWSCGWLGREHGYLGHISECHSSSSSSSWTRLWANLRCLKNNNLWSCVGQLFNENEKQIGEQTEITGVNTINFEEPTWMSTSLLCSRAYQITNAKTYVFSRLCALCRKNGRRSCCNLEEPK